MQPLRGSVGVDHRLGLPYSEVADNASRCGCRLENGMHSVAMPEIVSMRMSYETTMTMSVGAAICANCGFDSWLTTLGSVATTGSNA